MKTMFSIQSAGAARRPGRRPSGGFTLTELLCVIGIIGILLGIAVPAMQVVRQTARRAHCVSNLRQVMIATLAYEASGNGFPRADDGRGGSFLIRLLPYMEEPMLHDRAQVPLDQAVGETYQERLQELSDQRIELLNCPAAFQADQLAALPGQGTFTTHYYGIAGPVGIAKSTDGLRTYKFRQLAPAPTTGPVGLNGLFSPKRNGKFAPRRLKDVTDGSSHTFALGEISGYDKDQPAADSMRSGWAFGAGYDTSGRVEKLFGFKSIASRINASETDLNTLPFSSNHPGGTHFAFVDGSIHFVEQQISVDVLKTFASINGGERQEELVQ